MPMTDDLSTQDQNSNLILRVRSMYDYQEDRAALIDLFRRCEATNQLSATMSDDHKAPLISFHCEFMDYLWNMEQYPESYCIELVDSTNGRVVFVFIRNLKLVHFGKHLMTIVFSRLLRVEPDRRRQHLALIGFSHFPQVFQYIPLDFDQGYTLTTNTPSLMLQRIFSSINQNKISLLDILVIPTSQYATFASVHKLTQAEMERLCMVDQIEWVCRPVLSDLRHILNMKEYQGTFAVGDFETGQYSVASVWQSSSAILCDDRSTSKNAYRGSYWVAYNFYQSSSKSSSNAENEMLLSTLISTAYKNNIPFLLCHVDQSSIFNAICRQRAVAIATEILSRYTISQGFGGKCRKEKYRKGKRRKKKKKTSIYGHFLFLLSTFSFSTFFFSIFSTKPFHNAWLN